MNKDRSSPPPIARSQGGLPFPECCRTWKHSDLIPYRVNGHHPDCPVLRPQTRK